MRLRLFAVLALALLAGALVPVRAQDAPKPEEPKAAPAELTAQQKANVAVLDAVLRTIRNGFYDKTYGGKNLDEMRGRYLARVVASQPGEPLYKVIREMLGEFKVSHLTIIPQDIYDTNFAPEMNNTRSVRPGLDITETAPGQFFVSGILQGSAAEKAGVLRGDRIVEVNGVPAAESPLMADSGGDPGLPGDPHYFIRVPADNAPLVLRLQRRAQDKELVTVTLHCTATNMIEATRKSVCVIEHEGRKFGYIRFWHFLHGGMTEALRRALGKEFKDCDGLIIDLRGRGGSPVVMNDCFRPFAEPPRGGMGMGMGATPMPRWTRPVVALQDAGSRSAKEVYAHNWKWQKVGPLVGESTPGAVLGSTFAAMPDGSQLIYPAQNVRSLTFGQVELEGNPVEPTHPVKDLLPYAAGVDTIKEAGIKILYDLVKDKPKVEPAPDPDAPAKEQDFSIAPGHWRKAG
ncbi:MAG: PDZ domain-containing protein [Planctomycetes bacterium]|jgi:C-terminal processing protease CtpA/Prc|nr:PDZ domain-containing protein [Planctomycetota bacterium]MCL4729809.1 PDZ domain-containing protein [Planctomycetota bacterium]